MDNIQSVDKPISTSVVEITQSNIDSVIASNEVVLIHFYTEWCRFSTMLMPDYNETANELKKSGYESGKLVLGKVDCEKEVEIARIYNITKYPTLRLFRNGSPVKKEYRGSRSVQALIKFMKKQLTDPIIEFSDLKEIKNLNEHKRHIIGYLERRDQPEYDVFRKVASSLKIESCQFHVGFGEVSQQMRPSGQSIIVFRNDKTSIEPDETYQGSLLSYDELHTWMQPKCIPLVRVLTLENAEEFTEEGLPFLILFHQPSDTESVKKYKEIVRSELESEKHNINFVTADGVRFVHPMHQLGKSPSDLPLIAIDSFRRMYLFPDYKDKEKPGKLKQFVQDFVAGELFRELHSGHCHTMAADVQRYSGILEPNSARRCPCTNEFTRVVEITQTNVNFVLATKELVLLLYYCEGDPSSARMLYVFDRVAKEITEAGLSNKVVLAKVDCVKEDALIKRFQQTEAMFDPYPTIKLFTNGLLSEKRCRCKRTVQGFVEYIEQQLSDPIIIISSMDELQDLSEEKGHIVAYMNSKDQPEYEIVRKVATSLRDKCQFYVMFGNSAQPTNLTGQLSIVFRSTGGATVELNNKYIGSLLNFTGMCTWVEQAIFPLLREITSENEDELRINKNYPVVILLHVPSDTESVKKYKDALRKQFTCRKYINSTFLLAEGRQFEQLLLCFEKSSTDLPLIAIDHFNHIRLFDYNIVTEAGRLKKAFNAISKWESDQHHVTVDRLTPIDYTKDVYTISELFQ